jgi:hypothetical protein
MKKGFIGLAIVVFMLLVFGCATISQVTEYKEISLDELAKNRSVYREKPPKYGFIIEGQITNSPHDGYLEIDKKISVSMHSPDTCGKYHKCSYKGEEYNLNDVRKRVSDNRTITIHVSHYKSLDMYGREGAWGLYADKIEGLMTMEEATAYEAEKKAEAEAEQLAKAEARQRMLANFIIVPSRPNWNPSNYTTIDLFTAVANVEKMPSQVITSRSGALDFLASQRDYVSDVVFVSQNGTDIVFKTADNAISQNMKISERSSLTPSQRVRVYYIVTKLPLTEWNVVAIERL